LLVCGKSVGDAFNLLFRMERACQTQIMALSCNTKLVFPPTEIVEKTYAKMAGKRERLPHEIKPVSPWGALLRKLDRIDPSYKN